MHGPCTFPFAFFPNKSRAVGLLNNGLSLFSNQFKIWLGLVGFVLSTRAMAEKHFSSLVGSPDGSLIYKRRRVGLTVTVFIRLKKSVLSNRSLSVTGGPSRANIRICTLAPSYALMICRIPLNYHFLK